MQMKAANLNTETTSDGDRLTGNTTSGHRLVDLILWHVICFQENFVLNDVDVRTSTSELYPHRGI